MKLYRVDVSAYSNNAIRKEDGRFYMAHEVDAEIDALKMELIELRSELVKSGMERLALMDEVASLKENAKVYKWADAAMKDFSTTKKEE